MLLRLDSTAASVPWEWLALTLEDSPTPIVRQLMTVTRPSPVSDGQLVVVIGEPGGPASGLLPGARDEAISVANIFKTQIFPKPPKYEQDLVAGEIWAEPILSVSDTSEEVQRKLGAVRQGNVRVLHIASHGTLGADEKRPAIVLGSQFRLDAGFWKRLTIVPEVVFLNCCDIGLLEPGWKDRKSVV